MLLFNCYYADYSIPELSKIKPPVVAEESQAFYGENNNIKLRDNMINIQSKYISLLEDYVKLLTKPLWTESA